jgi:hypothetical protein
MSAGEVPGDGPAREFLGSPITSMYIEPEQRRRGLMPDREDCMGFHWGRQFYVEEARRWEFRKERLFTFSSANLVEMGL